jgi:hypothetical protein
VVHVDEIIDAFLTIRDRAHQVKIEKMPAYSAAAKTLTIFVTQ